MRSDRRRAGRAQSTYLSYLIIASAVIVGISVVVLFGTNALGLVQSSTIADNGEYAMQAVGSDMEAIQSGTAAVRNTELALQSATLKTGSPAVINVTAIHYEDSDYDPDSLSRETIETRENYTYRPVVYSTKRADIAYSNGLVIRDQQRGAVAVTEPLFSVSESQAVIPVVRTTAPVQSVSEGTHEVHSRFLAENGTTAVADLISDPRRNSYLVVNVTVETIPDRADVWGRVLNRSLADAPNPNSPDPRCERLDDETVSCDFRTNRLVVSNTTIGYEFR